MIDYFSDRENGLRARTEQTAVSNPNCNAEIH